MSLSPLAVAFSVVPRLPFALVVRLANAGADIATRRAGASVTRLAKNLARLTGVEPDRTMLRAAVRSHIRNYAEQLALGGRAGTELCSKVVFNGFDRLVAASQDGPVVLALGHSGSWDRAGAWACAHGLPVLTVAEKLDPPELFDRFVDLREGLGMEIIGAAKGDSVFSTLVERAEGRRVLVALLADRDVSGSGIEVDVGGHRALVAAGPAALATRLGRPLYVACISYEDIEEIPTTTRIDVDGPIEVDADHLPAGVNEVEAMTQAWVDAYVPMLRKHPEDWHMMQRVYVDDLDPERLARARERHRAEGGE